MSTTTRFSVQLERILKLLARGVCSEEEVTNQLIDMILLSDELVNNDSIKSERINRFVALVPPVVVERLKAFLMSCWKTDEEWEAVRVPMFGAEPSKELGVLMRKNVEALQRYFGMADSSY